MIMIKLRLSPDRSPADRCVAALAHHLDRTVRVTLVGCVAVKRTQEEGETKNERPTPSHANESSHSRFEPRRTEQHPLPFFKGSVLELINSE